MCMQFLVVEKTCVSNWKLETIHLINLQICGDLNPKQRLTDRLKGRKGKREMGWGSLGSARFGPGVAPQRGSGDLNGEGELAATLARGTRRPAHASVGFNPTVHAPSSPPRRGRLRGNPSYTGKWRGGACSPWRAEDGEAMLAGCGGSGASERWPAESKQRRRSRRRAAVAERQHTAASATDHPGTKERAR
jgi:hypothetical protein